MSKTKKYFPHSIDAVMDTEYPNDVPVEEFMDMRVEYWSIPSSIACIIRASDKKTGKVQEFSYQRHHAARKKVIELAKNTDLDILICDDDALVGLDVERLPLEDDDVQDSTDNE